MHPIVNGFHQTTVAGKQVKGADPSALNRPYLLGHFVVNILCSQQRIGLFGPLLALQALAQILLTLMQYSGIFSLHSKCFFLRLVLFSQN
jgi:hypothetical protein